MLKINLLPAEARKPVSSALEQFHRTPLMRCIVGGMVLLAALLILPVTLRKQQLQQLRQQVNALAPKKVELDQLQRGIQRLQAQEAAFREFGKGQGGWATRLNTLSDLTPEGVWFTELALESEHGLIIQGLAISQGGAEMVGIGRLVQDLKADPAFAAAVKDIQIDSIKRTQDREVEMVQFTLVCALVEGALP